MTFCDLLNIDALNFPLHILASSSSGDLFKSTNILGKLAVRKLIFNSLTDEHILRILFLQKIKKAKEICENITIYLDNIDLDEMNINQKRKIVKKEYGDIHIQYLILYLEIILKRDLSNTSSDYH